jgi:hypothetical protein
MSRLHRLDITAKAARMIIRGLRCLESCASTEADRAYARKLRQALDDFALPSLKLPRKKA